MWLHNSMWLKKHKSLYWNFIGLTIPFYYELAKTISSSLSLLYNQVILHDISGRLQKNEWFCGSDFFSAKNGLKSVSKQRHCKQFDVHWKQLSVLTANVIGIYWNDISKVTFTKDFWIKITGLSVTILGRVQSIKEIYQS